MTKKELAEQAHKMVKCWINFKDETRGVTVEDVDDVADALMDMILQTYSEEE